MAMHCTAGPTLPSQWVLQKAEPLRQECPLHRKCDRRAVGVGTVERALATASALVECEFDVGARPQHAAEDELQDGTAVCYRML